MTLYPKSQSNTTYSELWLSDFNFKIVLLFVMFFTWGYVVVIFIILIFCIIWTNSKITKWFLVKWLKIYLQLLLLKNLKNYNLFLKFKSIKYNSHSFVGLLRLSRLNIRHHQFLQQKFWSHVWLHKEDQELVRSVCLLLRPCIYKIYSLFVFH